MAINDLVQQSTCPRSIFCDGLIARLWSVRNAHNRFGNRSYNTSSRLKGIVCIIFVNPLI